MERRIDIPSDWISEVELAAAMNIADGDRSKFHRNLLNWRHNGLLPADYESHPVPMIRNLGFGVGNEAFYPPIVLPMLRRLDELRSKTHDMDDWLWRLWLERFPIDILHWCRGRIAELTDTISGTDQVQLVTQATRKPATRSDGRRSFYRRLKAHGWYPLMAWTINVAIGGGGASEIFDPDSTSRAALAKLVEPLVDPPSVQERLVGSGIEHMTVGRLLMILDGAIPSELEKAREDCLAWSRADERRDFLGFILSAMWRRPKARALMLPGLGSVPIKGIPL